VMEESVHQRPLPMPRGGMDHEPWGFVHCDHLIVFEKDVQGKRFGDKFGRRGRREKDMDLLSRAEAIARPLLPASNPNVTLVDEPPDLVARKPQKRTAHENIEPGGRILWSNL
jgi:hypothetical protein